MEVYHGAHTKLSSVAESNGDGAFMFVLLHVYSFGQTVYNPDLLPAIKIMHVKQLLRFCSFKFDFHWKISS